MIMKKILLAVLLVLLPSLAWGAAAVMYVSDSGSNTSPYETWAKAMNEASFETDLEGNAEAGDIYYVLGGSTLTLDSAYDSSAKAGTAVAPISIIGVKAATTAEPPTYSDWSAVGSADRPTIAAGANLIGFGQYYKLLNIIFTGSATPVVTTSNHTLGFNVKFYSTHDGGSGIALTAGGPSTWVSCEFEGDTNGRDHVTGATLASYVNMYFCYFHSLLIGSYPSSYNNYFGCIFDDCVTGGINGANRINLNVINCTFYDCTDGIYSTTGYGVFINNIMDTIGDDAFVWTTQSDMNFFWQNHEGSSVVDMWDLVATTMPHMDPEVTSGDPKFTTAGSDFSLQSSSPCLDAGFSVTLGAE